ncbi:MAG: glycosyltransferase family 39 protein [Acidobacteriota bacterium]|nr:MAG: glycosyltransferase family 39 protein [Acidobacteriota bacterium]
MTTLPIEIPLRLKLFSPPAMRQVMILLAAGALVVSLSAMAGWDEAGHMAPGLLAAVVCVMIIGGYFLFIRQTQPDWEWLLLLTFSAFFIRMFAAVAIFYFAPDRNFLAEDQPGYDYLPQLLANYWFGNGPRPEYLFSGFRGISRIGFIGLIAIQYLIFDVSYVVPRIFNCLAGAFLALFAYRITFQAYGVTAAKIAGILTAFFPSLILWSALNMRDIWLALTVIVITWHAVRLREKISIASVVVIGLCLVWMQMNRAYLVPIMGLTVASAFLFGRAREWYKDVAILGLMLLTVGVVLFFFRDSRGMDFVDFNEANRYRQVLAKSSVGNSGYLQNVDLSSPSRMLLYSPLLLAYFLFSPFPWDIRGVRQLMTVPEMLLWYTCLPFVFLSIREVIRDKTRKGLTLLMPLAIISVAYALSSGNMGLAYRHRAQVVALYLILAAAGFSRWKFDRFVKSNPQILPRIQQAMAARQAMMNKRQ